MRNSAILLGIIVVTALGFLLTRQLNNPVSPTPTNQSERQGNLQAAVIAENLDTPWALAFLPDKSMLITERPGRVRLIDAQGNLQPTPVKTLENVQEIGEGGLLGIALHPNFPSNHYIYLYYTYSGDGGNTLNRVVRMTYKNNQLEDETIVVDQIPGASNHNGGRIKFGPDNYLYITTGDAQNPSQAQDTNSVAGKILRVSDEGKPALGNPFGNQVYSYGHRNSQGLAWDSQGQLWATEHGRSGLQSGLDEINKIEAGKNYGWPVIQGDETREGMVTPYLQSGDITWAPSGAVFRGNSLFFAGLRGQTLYEAVFSGGEIELREHFKGEFGRIREVVLGPDNSLYITTSNRDGRGNPQSTDDRIIKVSPP